jgi:hypothetical protein
MARLIYVIAVTAVTAVIAIAGLAACGDSSDDSADAASDPSADAAAGADAAASSDATPGIDADPSACEPDTLWNVIEDRPLAAGDYCDDLQLCAADADAAAAIMAIEPGFDCDSPNRGGCAAGEVYCAWYDPDILDAGDYAGLCAITALPDAPERISCWVYL